MLQDNATYGIQVLGDSTPVLSGNSFSGNGINGVYWSGNVVANTTWVASSGPYVLQSHIVVVPGVTLTIEPGTVIKGSLAGWLQVSGTLHAQGTVVAPITFTSLKDDSVGGDTNNDGSATTPQPGDWAGLYFAGGASGNLLDRVVVRNAGNNNSGTDYGALIIQTSGVTLQNSIISDSLIGVRIDNASPTIRRNSIRGNGMGATGTGNLANNYWGSSTGPYDGSDDRATGGDYNPGGTGNGVSNGITYRPFLGSDPNPSTCGGSGTLSGKVIDRTTGVPKAGATVTLVGGSSTTSDGGGNFSFAGIAAGPYRITASLSGYPLGSQAVNVCGNTTANVDLTRSSTTNGLNSASAYSADPVNTATGNYVFQRVDLKLPGKGLPFVFERTYNAQEAAGGATGPLGYGWSHRFDARWSIDGAGNVTLRWGDGRTETHAPDGLGGFVAQYGVFDTLATAPTGGYTLTKKDRTRYTFNSTGRLASITDRNANALTLTYTGGLLTQVVDTAGRQIGFAYDGAARITSLSAPPARTILFTYDAGGNLVSSTDAGGHVTTYSLRRQSPDALGHRSPGQRLRAKRVRRQSSRDVAEGCETRADDLRL